MLLFIIPSFRHAANPADPLRNERSNKVSNAERNISKLVADYNSVNPMNRLQIPYLRHVQHHLANFYSAPPAEVEEETSAEEEDLAEGN